MNGAWSDMIIDKISHLSCKIIIIAIVFVFITISGCVSNTEKIISEENIGGKYDAKIVTLEVLSEYENPITKETDKGYFTVYEIHYFIEGEKYRGYWKPFYRDSIDWINQNTQTNSVFLNWWDYGNLIRGGTGRDVVISQPSKYLWILKRAGMATRIDEKTYEKEYGGFDSSERIKDVSLALTTDDITVTNQIMDKYNAKYIFLTMGDLELFDVMTIREGESNYTDYYTTIEISGEQQRVPNQRFYNSTLSKLIIFNGEDLKNYRLVYESRPQPYYKENKEKVYKAVYNFLYGGNLTVENTGCIKIFEYVKET